MKPASFEYHRPDSIGQAISFLAQLEDAKLLAGGQSLMPMMNFRYLAPMHLIDLNAIPELAGVEERQGLLRIGAMTRQRDLLDCALVQARCPLLIDALRHVGHWQTRNRGTIGGSLAHLDPAAELPAALAALDAVLEVRGPAGPREINMADWSQGYMTPALQADELLCAIAVPTWPVAHGHAFEEVARRLGDFAMAGAGVLLQVDSGPGSGLIISRIAIALTGVDVKPLRLTEAEASLTGAVASAENFAAASRYALDVAGLADVHASAAYRRKVAAVMTRRALQAALAVCKAATVAEDLGG